MSIADENARRHNHFKEENVNRCTCGNFIPKPEKSGLNRVFCKHCENWNSVYIDVNG